MHPLQPLIESAYEKRLEITPQNTSRELKSAIQKIILLLDSGEIRVAEKVHGHWHTHQWVKKAILLSFRIFENRRIDGGFSNYYDKIPLKFHNKTVEELNHLGIRIVPDALARQGAFIAPNTILMPSYVNIGAYIDTGTLIDTWATVGSCVQIGKNVHLSGGAGIGGVLEQLQANPTIIEDNCFIGARSEVVEGVIVEEGAVISMGVFIGQSTP